MTATVTNRWWWVANEWKSLFHAQINFPLYTINHSTMDCYDYDTFLTVCCLKLGLKINIFRLLLVVKVPIELLSTWHAMCCEVVQNLPPKNIPSLSLTAVPYTSSHSPTQIFELLFRFGRFVWIVCFWICTFPCIQINSTAFTSSDIPYFVLFHFNSPIIQISTTIQCW